MAKHELVRIKDGEETVLEVTQIPDVLASGSIFYPSGYIEKLEKHYSKTGKPKRGRGIDAIYICRPQVERWTDEELNASSLKAAREELKKRRQVKEKDFGQ